MNASSERPSRESVLNAFAVEREPDRKTLERYLRLYPEYAAELIDLSIELSCEPYYDDIAPLTSSEKSLIDAAWAKHVEATPTTTTDPFSSLTVNDWRTVAQRLDVPRQVVTALRERRVSLASIPRRFLHKMAEAMNSTVSQLESSWEVTCPHWSRSYKADCKPATGKQISLEQVLIDAGVPAEKIARLLEESD